MHSFGSARKWIPFFASLFVFLMWIDASASTQNASIACSNNLDSPIKNFCVVTPNVLWRGARPDKDGASWLIQHGVRTIVNLELILDDEPAFRQATVADTQSYEVEYFRVHDWEPLPMLAPSAVDDHVAHFLAIVDQEPKPVYVHCRSGINRTGVMIAAFRVVVENVSIEKAIEEMGRYQGQWLEPDAKYIRGLLPERREEIRRKAIEWIPKLKRDADIICVNGTCAVLDL